MSQTGDVDTRSVKPDAAPGGGPMAGWELMSDRPPDGLIRRFFTTQRHFMGLAGGGLVDAIRARRASGRDHGPVYRLMRAALFVWRPFLDRDLIEQPFPVQFRKRLEALGPTYIKLGQILALREDVLPESVTVELRNLLSRLPVMPFAAWEERVARDLGRPVSSMFSWIDPEPLGSASIAQIHRARTHAGDEVILKVVKPGIAETLRRDAVLLRILGSILEIFLRRYRPRRVIGEFCEYTLREVDLRLEADNAETFAANFRDEDGIVFPKIYREYSSERVLCMEYLDGIRPDAPEAAELLDEERDRLVDLGAEAIIRMLYKDGFFHADLHPGNLLILSGPRAGFIDLGTVGRFDDSLRRGLLYYFYCLVMKDAENAARYLTAVAEVGPQSDPTGFRREVEEICRRWSRTGRFEDFSLAQLVLESVGKAGRYHVYFPVELVLMVKALVTYEAVGHLLKPGFDVGAASRTHVNRIFFGLFNPIRIARESFRGAPEMVDAIVKAPLLVSESLKYLEQVTSKPRQDPFASLRGVLAGGFLLLAGAIIAAAGGPWPVWSAIFALGLVFLVRGRK